MVLLATLALSACTNSQPARRTAQNSAQYDRTQKRVYTEDDLRKTGRQTPGEALEAADPSVRLTGGR